MTCPEQTCASFPLNVSISRIYFPYLFRVSIFRIYTYLFLCIYSYLFLRIYFCPAYLFLVSILAPYLFSDLDFCVSIFPYLFPKYVWVFYHVFMTLWPYLFLRIYLTYLFLGLRTNIYIYIYIFCSFHKRGKTRVQNHSKKQILRFLTSLAKHATSGPKNRYLDSFSRVCVRMRAYACVCVRKQMPVRLKPW